LIDIDGLSLRLDEKGMAKHFIHRISSRGEHLDEITKFSGDLKNR